jgi:hypothetical protein
MLPTTGRSGSRSRPIPNTPPTPLTNTMRTLTTPIMSRQDDPDPDTQALEIVPEVEDGDDENDTRVIIDNDEDDDDGSWFLGGMFETE